MTLLCRNCLHDWEGPSIKDTCDHCGAQEAVQIEFLVSDIFTEESLSERATTDQQLD